jgi:ADP-ribosylglycohydrolase
MKELDRAKGVVFGLAIGDALGWPTEFMTVPKIKAKYGSDGITKLQEPAIFTDDTQMSIAIAEALIRTGENDIDPIMDAVRDEFIKWSHSPENNRAPGNACLQGVRNLEKGIHWSKSRSTSGQFICSFRPSSMPDRRS